MTENWKKVNSDKVVDVIDVETLEAESLELLDPGMSPERFIGKLSSANQWADAISVLTSALPKREAIWWACRCAEEMELMATNKWEAMALKAAEKWAFKPTPENRQDAFMQAQKSDSPSAGTLACMAVVFTEDKLELGDDQVVEFDASKFVGIAKAVILISASEKKGEQYTEALKQFMLKGEHIARGGSGKIQA